jgi:hypothetical protein
MSLQRYYGYMLTNISARNTLVLSTAFLLDSYSQKATFLKNVNPADSLYLATPESMTQSLVFPPKPVDQRQTPVAFTKLDKGWLGYIGDVNNDTGSQKVVLEMCRFAAYFAGSE